METELDNQHNEVHKEFISGVAFTLCLYRDSKFGKKYFEYLDRFGIVTAADILCAMAARIRRQTEKEFERRGFTE